MERTLKIYRASAGSGKTFTLALEYIKLVVENPYSYRNILAVTFTNKATGEMKERILGKLYGVANRSESAKDYFEKIKEQLPGMSEERIVANAQKALDLLLHDYGHFRIQTIDAFFQTVLRSLAKELDLNGDMEITLDSKELLSNAVDTYIKNLEPDTLNIAQVVRYIEDRLSNGEPWRVGNDIKKFAENILKEEYQQRGDELRRQMKEENGERLMRFYNEITARKRGLIEKAKSIGERFFHLADGYTADDFIYKQKGIWGVFEKMRNGNVPEWTASRIALADTPEKISKRCGAVNEIAELIREAVPLYVDFLNCELSLEHYHQLGMLNNIADTLKEENSRENRFLLAETTHLLSSMIEKNTTFIFEKIGSEIDHIFIDEFQDTSKLQWSCFHVLLEEILARGNFNLIVGDVKQSIYRWRNSDWNIMNRIGTHFRDDQITVASQDVKVGGKVYKSTNYRSDRRIISFNNALYRAAIDTIRSRTADHIDAQSFAEIEQAYEDVEQAFPQPKPGKPEKPVIGYAEVRVIPKNEEVGNFTDCAIAQLMTTLHRLLEEKNVAPRDIAILMRTKKNKMQKVVEVFNKEFPNLKIVSDEAYKLSSSLTVQLVIASLKYIAEPDDMVNIANMVRLYEKVIKKRDFDFGNEIGKKGLASLLPEEFKESLKRMKELPLYELIEQILAMLDITNAKDEEAYIYAFLDHASQYINSRSADIYKFLKAWDETIHDNSIPAESIDSIRIMTIHKSKGLEFHTVIIPMCDWTLTGDSRTLLWCVPEAEPFNTLSLLPIGCRQEMTKSIFRKEYHDEYMYQVVDNLNILYVATTRAKSNLFIFTDGTGGRGENVSKMMNTLLKNMTHLDGSSFDEEKGLFTYGEIVSSKKEPAVSKEKGDNPFETEPDIVKQPFTFYESKITFQQSNDLERFLAEGEEEQKQYDYIEEGKLMHLVMSGIESEKDITGTLDRLTIEGLIPTEEKYNRIKGLVERAVSKPDVADWFNGSYKLYNECTILGDKEKKSRRPDRVMIKGNKAVVVDYKFGRESDSYVSQVREYMELLRSIGYTEVKGYLWYVYKNCIKEV